MLRINIILALICSYQILNAQSFEQVHLKDGSVIEGYVCEQIPGKSLTVQACKATVTVSADSLISSTERAVPVSNLPTEWKSWMMEQDVTSDALLLTALKFPNSEYADAHIIENDSITKFISLEKRQYKFGWDDMVKTVKTNPRPEGQLSGINDVIVLKDGSRHTGSVSEQYPGKVIKLRTLENGNVVTVNAQQVEELQSIPAYDGLSILEQTPLLDRIYVKGRKKPVEGFITSRVTSKSITILTEDDEIFTYPIKDIVKYQKFVNPDYKVFSDRKLAEGEVLLNGDNAWFAPLQTLNGYLVLGGDASIVARKGDEITLEAKFDNDATAAINLIKAYRKDISGEKDRHQLIRDVFTYRDLVELALPVNRSVTPLGNTKVTFKVETVGDYVLSVQGRQGFIIINVRED